MPLEQNSRAIYKYSKQNTHSTNIIRWNFTKHRMQKETRNSKSKNRENKILQHLNFTYWYQHCVSQHTKICSQKLINIMCLKEYEESFVLYVSNAKIKLSFGMPYALHIHISRKSVWWIIQCSWMCFEILFFIFDPSFGCSYSKYV